jgi:predicted DNA-binding transcriptional regulator AlpA
MNDQLLQHPDLAPYFPKGRVPHASTLNCWERAGLFPAARRISKRYKAWRRSEIEAWFNAPTQEAA